MSKISEYSVLFVCTGNIFRSMTAEYALKNVLGPQSPVHVHSAGLIEAPHEIVPFVSSYMSEKNIDVSVHVPRKITRNLLDDSEVAVAMDFDHQQQIAEKFNVQLPLFSEIAFGKELPMLDVWEVVPDWRNNEHAAREYGQSVMTTIFEGMPDFAQRMAKFRL